MLLHYVQQPVTNIACRTQSEQAAAAPSQRVQEFLGVSSVVTGEMALEVDRRSGASSLVGAVEGTAVVTELSCKAKLSIYQRVNVLTLTYVHELWLVTKRIRS